MNKREIVITRLKQEPLKSILITKWWIQLEMDKLNFLKSILIKIKFTQK